MTPMHMIILLKFLGTW